MTTFTPLLDHVLLDLEPEPEMSTVIAVQKATEGLCRWGVITAIGPEVRDAQIGQRVLVSITAGSDLPMGTLIRESAIYAYER